MRLKSLELQGFKSFPDKTVLCFNSGITAVIGPNGSGKSNIADAVRWVLGEMSTKNIRGNKMEDVIFGGSDNRRPIGYAEVSLVIDNTAGLGKLESDFDEVTVTRRYYRGGESEYMINRRPVRLRDIAELFMNTGVGKTGYSNISQGKIAEIISQKSEERRSVFEEAAGISKYRFKKNECERKLKDVEANSLRLYDILQEYEKRIGPLEKEAAAAKKYIELYEQKKAVDISLWLYDAENIKIKGNETERAYVAAKLELEAVDGEIQSLEAKSDRLYQSAQENKLRSEQTGQRINEYINKLHDIDSSNRVIENDISHIKSMIGQTELDLKIKRDELSKAEEKSVTLISENSERETRLKKLNDDIIHIQNKAEEQRISAEAAEKRIYESENNQRSIEAGILELKVRLSALEGSHEAESGRSEGIEEELEKLEASLGMLSEKIEKARLSVSEYEAAITAEEKSFEDSEREERDISAELERAKEQLSKLRLDISSKQQRADNLRRMDELFEGYNHSVQFIMRASGSGTLSGICGPVSRLIRVNPEYSIAVETALGANIQNIITEDENAAKAAIAYLKRNNAGRATFYPITSVRPQPLGISESDLRKCRGYIGIGSELAECDAKYSDIIKYMLGRTVVFDNIDNAADTAKAFGYRVRIVTLDGQLINAGGSFTGGSVKHDSGILTRANEIAVIKNDIAKLNISQKAIEAQIRERAESLEDRKNKSAGFVEKINILKSLCQAEKTNLEVLRTRYENEEKRRDALAADLDRLGRQHEHYETEHTRLNDEISAAHDKLAEAAEITAGLSEELRAAEERLSKTVNDYNALMLEKTALEKDIEALGSNLALNTGTRKSLSEQIIKNEQTIYALNEKLIAAQNTIESNRLSAKALDNDIEALEAERRSLAENNLEYEKQESRLREQIRDKSHAREVIFREYTKYETAREQLLTERDRLAAKIWDDYELTYSAAIALNYPQVTAENRPSFASRQNELKAKIKALGSVNTGAIEEFNDVKQKYDFMTAQYNDLRKAGESLTGIITRLEHEMRVKFSEAIVEINRHFKAVFRELFGGGNAEISLSDPENVLTSGIDINVAPPGKIIKNLISLSGGEQAFVAIALVFAILNVNPTPFCIFDEIESALDEVNVNRLADYMKRYSEKTQFIIITHRRGTMEAADMIYGITMPDRGVSKVLSMDISEAEKKIGDSIN